jgi:hypothetical protein
LEPKRTFLLELAKQFASSGKAFYIGAHPCAGGVHRDNFVAYNQALTRDKVETDSQLDYN